jgi:hypothetical protein
MSQQVSEAFTPLFDAPIGWGFNLKNKENIHLKKYI